MKIGLDIGSTTIKSVVMDDDGNLLYSSYERHKSDIYGKLREVLNDISGRLDTQEFEVAVSGSAGIGLAERLSLPFVQEVFAVRKSSLRFFPGTDVVIELGGEDAKILFFSGGEECRMNGSCAGGTGAFIDQMAELLATDAGGMEKLAAKSTRVYTIASRCGVFAKSDIQPLLNQGALKTDIAMSVFYAVVNQTVSGLAQGRRINGNVLYLGGPLHFFPSLRSAFDSSLGLEGTAPENSLFFVAMGAVLAGNLKKVDLNGLLSSLDTADLRGRTGCMKPLFENDRQYEDFKRRHGMDSENVHFVRNYSAKRAWIGIDAGSTTVKAVLVDENNDILDSLYSESKGDSLGILKDYIESVYSKYAGLEIAASAVTGYGEELVKNAFGVDCGVVETVAHFKAASHFVPNVDFIIDIGGQDIKCFKVKNSAIDSLFLNEACSSGCGSFLSTFAHTMGYGVEEFSRLAIKAAAPRDLGSRCTVFMNSAVKQAQKDGAGIEDIAAGLAVSVVKNALYKVIRTSRRDIGEHIVVQGGTFLSDAVLRAFEQETGRECIRPSIAGLMGCYGAALYARQSFSGKSTFISRKEIAGFSCKSQSFLCSGCTNHCHLTINTFAGGGRFVAGNKCEKPLGRKSSVHHNIYEYKKKLLSAYRNERRDSSKMNIGLPVALNMYELLPFWHTLFSELGCNVMTSPECDRNTYLLGQYSISSDTVCYPAKLVHGCVEELKKAGADLIFYPSMTYSTDEGRGDNHYNCPVVAYYPEVLGMNMQFGKSVFANPFVNLADRKKFPRYFARSMGGLLSVSQSQIKSAAKKAFSEYDGYLKKIAVRTEEFIQLARDENLPVILLAGRPYHIDREINHGIDKLICDLGAVVVSEDGVCANIPKQAGNVLDQWTYHSRMYAAARYVASCRDLKINLVQLISFGCGIDAITSDEVRGIIESGGKIYTSIKIDEIANLGAAGIRLRSLFAVLNGK